MGSLGITFSAHKFGQFPTFWTNHMFVKYIRHTKVSSILYFQFFTLQFHFSVYFSICLRRISKLSRNEQVLLHQAQECFLIIFQCFFFVANFHYFWGFFWEYFSVFFSRNEWVFLHQAQE